MAVLIPCQACGRQVSTAATQCMNCGHPVKVGHPYTWLLVLLVVGVVSVIALGAYRAGPVLKQALLSVTESVQDEIDSFGVASLPKKGLAVSPRPAGGRQPTKTELSKAAQKLDAAVVPYWNHVYKIDRIYYQPTDHILHIDFFVREEFEDVDKSMLRATHRDTFCSAAAYSIFRSSEVTAQWDFRAYRDNELLYSFKILHC